jgi:hypothetical protein
MRLGVLPAPLHWANEGLALLVELAALGALAWWGARTGSSLIARVLMGVGAPLGAAAVWSAFAAPKAWIRLPMAGLIAVKALVFAAATAAIYAAGRHGPAIGFALVALVNTAIAAGDRNAAMRVRSQ